MHANRHIDINFVWSILIYYCYDVLYLITFATYSTLIEQPQFTDFRQEV